MKKQKMGHKSLATVMAILLAMGQMGGQAGQKVQAAVDLEEKAEPVQILLGRLDHPMKEGSAEITVQVAVRQDLMALQQVPIASIVYQVREDKGGKEPIQTGILYERKKIELEAGGIEAETKIETLQLETAEQTDIALETEFIQEPRTEGAESESEAEMAPEVLETERAAEFEVEAGPESQREAVWEWQGKIQIQFKKDYIKKEGIAVRVIVTDIEKRVWTNQIVLETVVQETGETEKDGDIAITEAESESITEESQMECLKESGTEESQMECLEESITEESQMECLKESGTEESQMECLEESITEESQVEWLKENDTEESQAEYLKESDTEESQMECLEESDTEESQIEQLEEKHTKMLEEHFEEEKQIEPSEVGSIEERLTEDMQKDGTLEYIGMGKIQDLVYLPVQPAETVQDFSLDGAAAMPILPELELIQNTKIPPVVWVNYDQTEGSNGAYYNTDRVATIVICSPYFDSKGVTVKMTAMENGKPKTPPGLSEWSSLGEIHTASIHYTEDGWYTLEVFYEDTQGMAAEPVYTEPFFIDQTKPEVILTDLTMHSGETEPEAIDLVLTAKDANFDTFLPVLTAVVLENGQFVTKPITTGEIIPIQDGQQFVVKDLQLEGIYQLSCSVVDKAGNVSDGADLYEQRTAQYAQSVGQTPKAVLFSVIQNGSVFIKGTYAAKVSKRYYVQQVQQDIEIQEINPDRLRACQVLLNGRRLEEGKEYCMKQERKEGQWNTCTYLLFRELFAQEGEYNIVIVSKDQADQLAFNDMREAGLRFVVDRKAPQVVVSGLQDGGRYHVQAQRVKLFPSDDGGMLASVQVKAARKEGEGEELLFFMEGKALVNLLETDGCVQFLLKEGQYEYIQIVCEDASMDEGNKPNRREQRIYDVDVFQRRNKGTWNWVMLAGGGLVFWFWRKRFYIFFKKDKK